MSEDKKVRPMTAKRFAKLNLSGKSTAEGLLAAHMAFLENHSFLKDILQAYKDKELLPTPTLQTCQHLLFTHAIESEIKTAQATIQKNIETYETSPKDEKGNVISSSEGPKGNYLITLMVKSYTAGEVSGVEVGTIEVAKVREIEINGTKVAEKYKEISPAIWAKDDYGSAERLADRRLFEYENSVYAIIENTIGQKVVTNVMRGDSFARMLKKNKSAVMRERGKSTKTLGFGVKAKNDRSTGPWSIMR